jgi:hypothetical protein
MNGGAHPAAASRLGGAGCGLGNGQRQRWLSLLDSVRVMAETAMDWALLVLAWVIRELLVMAL